MMSTLAVLLLAIPLAGQNQKGPPVPRAVPKDEPPGLEVKVRSGIGGFLTVDALTPIIIDVVNKGATLEGTWELINSEGGESYKTHLVRKAFIPAQGRQKIRMYGPPLNPEVEWVLRLVVDGREVLRRWLFDPAVLPTFFSSSETNILLVHPEQSPGKPSIRGTNITPPAKSKDPAVRAATLTDTDLPTHAETLLDFNAIILYEADKTIPLQLTPKQGQVLRDYINWGGAVLVPRRSDALWTMLSGEPPLPGATTDLPPVPVDVALGRPGGGAVVRYEGTAGAAVIRYVRTRLAPEIPRNLAVVRENYRRTPPESMASFTWIGVIFSLYVLLSGPVVLIFFRNRRRRTAITYVLSLVGIAVVVSLLIGPILGSRRGDLEWTTVAEIGNHGVSEWGVFTLTSAGGRAYSMGVGGDSPYAWLLPPNTATTAPTFWQLSYSDNRGIIGQNNFGPRNGYSYQGYGRMENPGSPFPIPIGPWATRIVTASASSSDRETLKVTLTKKGSSRRMIRLENGLDVNLHQVQLLVGRRVEQKAGKSRNPSIAGPTLKFTMSRLDSLLEPGKVKILKAKDSGSIDLSNIVQRIDHYLAYRRKFRSGIAATLPTGLEEKTGVSAYILANVKAPLVLRPLTETFVIHRGRHWILYRIPDEAIPDGW